MDYTEETTFVTAFFNIYEIPFENKDIEWRINHFKKIAETGICIACICSPDLTEYMQKVETEYPNVKVLKYMNLSETNIYNLVKHVDDLELPNSRNIPKDTAEYIVLQNSKIEVIKMAMDENPWSSTKFAWIDFNIFHVLINNVPYAQRNLKYIAKSCQNITGIHIPGCVGKERVQMERLTNNISWRFCGGFFLGSKDALLNFYELYQLHFVEFLKTYKKLIWEVNFWAWLELEKDWNPIWYNGDHNERILEIQPEYLSQVLSKTTNYISIKYNYPDLKEFIPASTAYIYHKGKHIINTRYINYTLNAEGRYWIRDKNGHIITRNFASILDETTMQPISFEEMNMSQDSELKCNGGSIYGLEDIRLFKISEEDIGFIATNINYSPTGRNRMIMGKYDINDFSIKDCKILVPPNPDSWCEKNWIPLDNLTMIYKWHDYEFGKLDIDTNQLNISNTPYNLSAPFFHRMRGSTIFQETTEGRLGVVHFSEEGSPRKYFHALVLLDNETFLPIKHSRLFCFNKISIEFCIGFAIIADRYHFWISNFDRDPELLVYDISDIPLLFNM